MNKVKTISLVIATSLLVTSCASYSQFGAGATGAMVGSRVGRDVGFLVGGHRHFGGSSSALGSLIGAGVGAALGVGIQNSIEQSRERRYAENAQNQYQNQYHNQYQGNSTYSDDYQSGGGSDYARSASSNSYLSVEPLSYMDADGDGYVSKGETIEIETYITNKSNTALQNVKITIDVPEKRYVTVSSPLVTNLSPGQKIRYTGRIYCQKAKANTVLNVSLNVNANNQDLSSGNLPIYMK